MPISMDCTSKLLKVKALKSPIFAKDRNALAKITGRTPIWGIDQETGTNTFQYWEIPLSSLSEILNIWTVETIVATPAAKKLIDRFSSKLAAIEDLPREVLRVDFKDESKTLKDFQEAYITISNDKDALLCSMAIGRGKSGASALRSANIGFKKLLIIGPRKLDRKWRADIREDLDRDLLIYWGTKAQREKLRVKIEDFDIFYTNFEQLEEFSKYCPEIDHVIVDEIHCACNPDTKIHKSLYKFLRNCQARGGYIQGLSATPLRHKLEDLWGVWRLLDPDTAGSKKTFLDEYQKVLATMPVKKTFRQKDGTFKTITFDVPIKVTTKNEDKLREKLKCIMFQVGKSTDFKDNIEIIDTPMTPRQISLYEEALETLRIELQDKTLNITNPLAKMTRLLQISEGLFNLESKHKDSGKLEFLKDDIKEKINAGEQVIVWSRFEPITREIQACFPNDSVIYSGSTSNSLRDLGVWAFQGIKAGSPDLEEFERLKKFNPDFKFKPGEAKIFAGTHSLKSGMGLNFQNSHICYFSSFDFSHTAIQQARGRQSRIGQTTDTETYYLVSEGTIEKRCLKLILTGLDKSLNLLEGGSGLEANLNRKIIRLLYD